MNKISEESSLNGLWGWIKKHVNSIAAVATALGLGALAITLKTIVAADGGPGEGQDGWRTYEPTGNEKLILDNWAQYQLKPYYETLLHKVNNIFNSQNFNDQIDQVNSILKNIVVVTNYYSANETNGITASGIALRLELIEIIFAPLKDLIANSLESNLSSIERTSYEITFIDSSDYNSLNIPNSNVSYIGEKYVITNSTTTTPVVAGINLNSTDTVITPHLINYTSPSSQNSNIQSTPVQPNDSDSGQIIKKVVFVIASYFLIKWALTEENEEKNQELNEKDVNKE